MENEFDGTENWSAESVATLRNRIDFCESCGEYEYMDNVRYARAGNKQEVEKYIKQAGTGCCGSYDDMLFVYGANEIILVGFNYGH